MVYSDIDLAAIPGRYELRQLNDGSLSILHSDWSDEIEKVLVNPPQKSGSIGTGKGETRFYHCAVMEVAVKEYRHGGILAPVLRDLYLPPPHRSVEELRLLAIGIGAELPVPFPLAATIKKAWGPFYQYRLCTRKVVGARNLLERLRSGERGHEECCAIALRRFHNGGLLHRDLNLANFIIGDAGVFICDLDRGAFRHPVSSGDRQRNLRRLEQSVNGKDLQSSFSMDHFRHVYWQG